MDTNENLLQINTFIKGMNTDISDMMLDPLQYRYAENLRLVTGDNNNSGELRMIEGLTCQAEPENFGGDIIFLASARNYVVAIIKNNNTWWIKSSDDNGLSWDQDVFNKYKENIDKLWIGNGDPHISGVLNYESSENINLYFVDDTGKHGIMRVNILKDNGNKIEDIISNTESVPNPPVVSISDQTGTIDSVKVLYAYRLYNKYGSATNISILSEPISLYKCPGEGFATDSTNKAVDIRINSNISKYNKILIYRISYYEIGQKPRVFLIRDTDFTNGSTITDVGLYKNEISFDEFLALDNIEINPKIIKNRNNFLFAANVSYGRDSVDEKFKTWDAKSISSGMVPVGNNLYTHQLFSNGYKNYNEEYWYKLDSNNLPIVGEVGGTGTNIDWEFTKIYTNISVKSNHSNQDTFYGFKHDETYRFGIILYDEYNRRSSVKWIADIRIPPFDNTSEDEDVQIYYDSFLREKYYRYCTRGIKFTVKNLPEKCSGFEIVRCERTLNDKHILFLGISGRAMTQITTETIDDVTHVKTDPYVYPSGLFTLLDIYATLRSGLDDGTSSNFTESRSSSNYIQFACPEYSYMPDSTKDVIETFKENIKLRLQHIYDTDSEIATPEIDVYTACSKKDRLDDVNPNPYFWGIEQKYGYLDKYNLFVDPKIMKINIVDTSGYNQPSVQNSGHVPASHIYCNYIVPNAIDNPFVGTFTNFSENVKITNIGYCNSPKWNEFASNNNLTYRDFVTVVGNKQFINWTTPLINDKNLSGIKDAFNGGGTVWGVPNNWDPDRAYYPIGSGGSCIIFNTDEPYCGTALTNGMKFAPICITNVVKNCIPYNGYSKDAIENSTYYSYGDYAANNNSHQCIIEVKSGDCYPCVFLYNASHIWNDPTYIYAAKMATIYSVPIESDINLNAQSGFRYTSDHNSAFLIQDDPASLSEFNYIQEKSSYIYKNTYHIQNNAKSFSYQEIISLNYDNRIHNSAVKVSNEYIDSWLRYKSIDYIDCDSSHGQITQLDNFKDLLLFWQQHGFGVISSNERNIIQNTDGVNLILGNGDVLQRYDYISTIYGMKYGQFANAQSDNSEYWWDSENSEILLYTKGSIPTPISTTKGVKLYVNVNNKGTSENKKPHVTYDRKYKEVIFSVVNELSISYTEQLQAFLSVYTFPIHLDVHSENEDLVSIKNTLSTLDWKDSGGKSYGINENGETIELFPKVKFVINKNSTANKVFDILSFGGRIYGGDDLSDIRITYDTPLKQHSELNNSLDISPITNREYDFRVAIPRHNNSEYGDRLRGKTMQCELSSTSNSTDFSLQYIITKYRISWS